MTTVADPTAPDAAPDRVAKPETRLDGKPLRLLAFDEDDLSILSVNLQDALVSVSELAYLPKERRFALVAKRYDWVKAARGECERCATGLHFDFVQGVTHTGFGQGEGERVLHLLAITFEPGEAPAGTLTLTFAGGAAVRLAVECLDAQMRDLGERFACDKVPPHALDEDAVAAMA